MSEGAERYAFRAENMTEALHFLASIGDAHFLISFLKVTAENGIGPAEGIVTFAAPYSVADLHNLSKACPRR